MPSKPWPIILISAVYFLSPLGIIFFNASMNMIPLIGPSSIFVRLRLSDWVILFLYVLIAVSIFTVRKFGWWFFLCSSGILIGYNIFGYLQNPLHPFPALLIYNTLLFLGAALLFRKEVIAPYFNPRLRWWESDPRYSLEFNCVLGTEPRIEAAVRDISLGGCFISTVRDIPLGGEIPIELRLQNISLHLTASGVRKATTPFSGWGLRFVNMTETELHGLKMLLNKLKDLAGGAVFDDDRRLHPRLHLSQWVYWRDGADNCNGRLVNVSRSGCCLLHENGGFYSGESYNLHFSDFDAQLILCSHKIWDRKGNDGIVTGLNFVLENRDEKLRLRNFINYCKRAGSRERNENKRPDARLIRASLEMTPVPRLYNRGN